MSDLYSKKAMIWCDPKGLYTKPCLVKQEAPIYSQLHRVNVASHQSEPLLHSQYSPDFVPMDSHLFAMTGERSNNVNETVKRVLKPGWASSSAPSLKISGEKDISWLRDRRELGENIIQLFLARI